MATHTCHQKRAALGAALAITLAAATASAQSAPAPGATTPIEVRGGTASFDVGTNVPALSVRGRPTALEARGRIRPGARGPEIEQIEAVVPVGSLATRASLRDSRRRKY